MPTPPPSTTAPGDGAPAPERHPEAPGFGRGFRVFAVAIFLNGFAVQIQTVAVGWQVYALTRNPLDLGLVGLSQFAPALLLILVTGTVVDRAPRRLILALCLALQAAVALGLLLFTLSGSRNIPLVFLLMTLFGVARAFYMPTRQALLPNLVSTARLPRALALTGSLNQFANISGPVAGGLLIALAPVAPYATTLLLLLGASVLTFLMPNPKQVRAKAGGGWAELTAGFRYIWKNKLILGAVSLDLFVVLLGGALALLPVYASDVLDAGSLGLGFLRMAPAVGALSIGLWLARTPIRSHVGTVMFAAVAVFSLATLTFALSTSIWLSVIALAVVGGSDMLSVVIRGTLVQLHTPDSVRGRVSAVNHIFIGASNEVGAFRAGGMAALVGPVAALSAGAVVSLGVCALWMRLFPGLRNVASFAPPPVPVPPGEGTDARDRSAPA